MTTSNDSDKITEKLGAEGNKQIEDLRKAVDSLPAKPNLGIFYKNITKYQEINLELITIMKISQLKKSKKLNKRPKDEQVVK